MNSSVSEKDIHDLVNRKLSWSKLKELMSGPKDPDRLDKYIKVLQKQVSWKEKIILPIHEHLFIVCKNGKLIVKAKCGYEFGDYRENWKLYALIYVRNTKEALEEIYPEPLTPDPSLVELREYYCPGCGELLDVEATLPGHPIIFEFLPDIRTFYEEWLNKPVPCKSHDLKKGIEDRSISVIKKWSRAEIKH